MKDRFPIANKVFPLIEQVVSHMKTDCFSLLEQTVSLYLNKVFISVN